MTPTKKAPTLYGLYGDILFTVAIPVIAKGWLVYSVCVQLFTVLLADRPRLADDMVEIVSAVTQRAPLPQLLVATALLSGLVLLRAIRVMRAPSINSNPAQPKVVDPYLPLIIKGLRLVLEVLIAPMAVVAALVGSTPEFSSPAATLIECQLGVAAALLLLLLVFMEYLARVHADPLELLEIRISRPAESRIETGASRQNRIDQQTAHEWFTDRIRATLAYTNQLLFVDAVFAVESETCAIVVGFLKRYSDWADRDKDMLFGMLAALESEWKDRNFEVSVFGFPVRGSQGPEDQASNQKPPIPESQPCPLHNNSCAAHQVS